MERKGTKVNFLYNMVYQVALMILPLITMPYVSRVLGAEGIGTYSYTYSIAQYFLLFGMLGVENYGNRSIARVRDDEQKRSAVFSSIYTLQFIIASISVIVYVLYIAMFSGNKLYAFLQVFYADDYYGKEGFKAVHEYLVNGGKSCMAGFVLKNTLSDNGGVTRGICKMDENGNLTEVVETKNIVKTADGAEADGVVVDVNSLVSMNMWGLTPDFLDVLENGFKEFFEKEVPSNPQKAEYLIPIFIGELLEQGKMSVKVLKTNDTWYGMTYHEDVAAVKNSFKKMLADGVYKADLFSDL